MDNLSYNVNVAQNSNTAEVYIGVQLTDYKNKMKNTTKSILLLVLLGVSAQALPLKQRLAQAQQLDCNTTVATPPPVMDVPFVCDCVLPAPATAGPLGQGVVNGFNQGANVQ